MCDLDDNDFMGNRGMKSTGSGTRGTIVTDIGLDEDGNHDPDTDWAIVQAVDYDDTYEVPENPIPAEFLKVEEDGAEEPFYGYMSDQYTLYDKDGSKLYETEGDWEIRIYVTNLDPDTSHGAAEGETGSFGGTTNESSQLD